MKQLPKGASIKPPYRPPIICIKPWRTLRKKKSKEERWFDGFIGVGLILKAVSQLPPAQWAAIPVQRGNDDKQQISFYDKQLTFVCPEMMISGRLQLIVCWVLTRKSHLLFCYFLNSLKI